MKLLFVIATLIGAYVCTLNHMTNIVLRQTQQLSAIYQQAGPQADRIAASH